MMQSATKFTRYKIILDDESLNYQKPINVYYVCCYIYLVRRILNSNITVSSISSLDFWSHQ